jgi:hypothetical protein
MFLCYSQGFRLEQYSWRDQEAQLNDSVAHYRVKVDIPETLVPLRVHFIHEKSPHANAIPLLLIPPFPFTNFALSHLVKLLVNVDDAAEKQPFNVVIPSLPGIGFSDALPNRTHMISATAYIFDSIMKRAGYDHYLVSNTAPSANSLANLDWRIADYLAVQYSDSCCGAHFISPPLKPPTLRDSPSKWLKWKLARASGASIFGYSHEDHTAKSSSKDQYSGPPSFSFGYAENTDSTTLAYALCDSPTGMLLFTVMLLNALGSQGYEPADVITMTALAWLPGPEAALKFWAHCASNTERKSHPSRVKPRVTITIASDSVERGSRIGAPRSVSNAHVCAAWGKRWYDVVASRRIDREEGLLPWQQPDLILQGVRQLGTTVVSTDSRMQRVLPGAALLEQAVVDGREPATAKLSGSTIEATANSTASPGGSS